MTLIDLPDQFAQALEHLAKVEQRPIEAVLNAMLGQYTPQLPTIVDEVVIDEEVRQVRLRTYERARRYWREHDDPRAAMTDDELEEQFWLIDYDGIPRLKSEQGTIDVPPSTLDRLLEAGREANLFPNTHHTNT